ncbi:MAG: iron ABC transporter permease [Symploca sp. SIO2G7]|nr:iron ABC transporter permease [Symploca sp. SIO2G7]
MGAALSKISLKKEVSKPPQKRRYRLLTVGLLLFLGLFLAIAISLSFGSVSLSRLELWTALLKEGSSTNQTIVWDLRLPRVLAAMVVGSALGMAGSLLQGMLRNALASPFLLGISSGAGLAAVLIVGLQVWDIWLPLGAWLGAVIAVLIVFALAKVKGEVSVTRLILGGVAVSALFAALQTMLLLLSPDGRVQAALTWLTGSLNGRGWQEIKIIGPSVVIALLLGCLLARQVNLLNLGDELAVGLGSSLVRSRLLIGAVATLLTAGAVSIAGLVGFIGLLVPHGVRLLVGNDYRLVLPFSAVGGALVLCIADLLARLGPIELPVGIITSIMGAPVFMWLLYRRSSSITGG